MTERIGFTLHAAEDISAEDRLVYSEAFECAKFVTEGKGVERHGHGHGVATQPWVFIEEFIPGFCSAQAVKKIIEAQAMEGPQRARELQGAVGYLLLQLLKEGGK